MTAELTELDRCLIHRAIEDLLHTAQHALDEKDYPGFARLFTENGRLYRPTTPDPLVGPEAILASYAQNPANRFNRHLITNLRVEPASANEARAHAYVTLLSTEEGDKVTDTFGTPAHRCLVGEFHDHCIRTEQGWRFLERRAEFTLNLPITR